MLAGCSSSKKTIATAYPSIGSIKYINQFVIPDSFIYKGTVVGGLSGIDYNKKKGEYYMICDDPSVFSPARFYTAKIKMGNAGIENVQLTDVALLRNQYGELYPNLLKERILSADLESLRYDPVHHIMVRGTEGQRVIRKDTTMLQSPDVVAMDKKGNYKDSFALPANMRIQITENGPRHNAVFEGLAFNTDYSQVYVSVEEPIYEDGERAATGDSTAFIRIIKFDVTTKQQLAQYIYQIDAVPHPATPASAFKVNGVSDIMFAGDDKLVVIERAYSTGRIPSDVRVYLADLKNAVDVSKIVSVKTNPVQPLPKKLLVNMEDLAGTTIYNIEGVTYGPKLANGNASLIFVADNNFSKKEKSQFLLFEIIP